MKQLLQYEIIREIGRGGMASVHEAMHIPLRRRVAIKVMLPQLAADPKSVARFEREARLASSVRHPHVVEIFDFGNVDGVPFLVMELLIGETLAARLARGNAIAIDEAVAFVLPIASAVAHAHAMEIVHRDLKPANIFLSEGIGKRLWPKVLDFGISKQTAAAIEASTREGLTSSASMVGTLSYMAPEQIQDAGAVTAKTDQYALAVMLYECVTGRLPFFGANSYQLMHSILNGSVTPPSALAPHLPSHLDEILLRALERDPANRHPSVHAFASLLLPLGGRQTCALWASEFAGASEVMGQTQNGDAPPSPSTRPRPAPAKRRAARHLPVAWIVGLGFCLSLLGALGLSRSRAAPPASEVAPTVTRSSEASVVVPEVSLPSVTAPPPHSQTTETPLAESPKSAAQAPVKPRARVGSSTKPDPIASPDSREPKPITSSRTAPSGTPPPARPGVGTNEAPIFE